ncbi:MAG TPA: glycosyltransferase family 2 protein [Tepidisphaeraceae bacterium]|nr:glycosyltransferase family 2 protein [Tepidisphaeraceae bacterium]
MRLLVVIVNYRTADLTVDCLGSLADQIDSLPGARVVITDNASGDDSVEKLNRAIARTGWSAWATLLPLDRNGGFAFGNNAAIRPALQSADPPDYVLLLNPDTLVLPGAINALLEFMDAHREVGIAGSRLEHPDGTPQRSAFRFHSVLGELESGMRLGFVSRLLKNRIVAPPVPAAAGPTDWVAGAGMIVRREVFSQIGLMDEGYFMYFEEVDFCLRASRAGWPCWYVPQSRVIHLVGQSSGVTDAKRSRKRRPAYWFASRKRFFRKNLGRGKMLLANLAWAGAFASYRLRRPLQRKPDTDPAWLLWDFLRYNAISHRAERFTTEARRH